MRRLLLALCLLAPVTLAQDRPDRPQRPIRTFSPATFLAAQLDEVEERLRDRTAAVKRDAFIVAQVVSGVGELNDFQRNVALQKALDRVEAALQKAGDRPPASAVTLTALKQIKDELVHARDNSGMADLPELKQMMLEKTHTIQYELFTEVDGVRRDRQILTDIQARLGRMGGEMDEAMTEALGSIFEFFKAGGK
jgi:hypothetical protein